MQQTKRAADLQPGDRYIDHPGRSDETVRTVKKVEPARDYGDGIDRVLVYDGTRTLGQQAPTMMGADQLIVMA